MNRNERIITEQAICEFARHLEKDEKSAATIEKYQRDLHRFKDFAADRMVDKKLVMWW